jgi:hypothetical protein
MRLLLIVVLTSAVACGVFAQGHRPVHPASKGVKIGALGKDYIALSQPYSWVDDDAIYKLPTTIALPAGVYRVKFEDEQGYYLPAPGKLGRKALDSVWTFDGGLYVRKANATSFWVYEVDKNGKFVPTERELPKDAVKHFRQ